MKKFVCFQDNFSNHSFFDIRVIENFHIQKGKDPIDGKPFFYLNVNYNPKTRIALLCARLGEVLTDKDAQKLSNQFKSLIESKESHFININIVMDVLQ